MSVFLSMSPKFVCTLREIHVLVVKARSCLSKGSVGPSGMLWGVCELGTSYQVAACLLMGTVVFLFC